MTSSPTAGWLRCRTFTNVAVPPRASSRRVVAVAMCGTAALATEIPAALATPAADATATIAPLPNLRLMWSMTLPLEVRGGRQTLPVSPLADTGPATAPRLVAGYPPHSGPIRHKCTTWHSDGQADGYGQAGGDHPSLRTDPYGA